MRNGMTLVEVLLVVVVTVLLTGAGIGSLVRFADRLAVLQAVNEVIASYRTIRLSGILAGRPARLEIRGDSLVGFLELPGGDSVVASRPGPRARRVTVSPPVHVFRFYSTGIAAGAGNLSLTFSRGKAVDTLVTSRVGRLRRRKAMVQPSVR